MINQVQNYKCFKAGGTMSTVETPWFVLLSPELGKKFHDFHQACNEDGVLDKKTKELLMLALASVFRCPHCTEAHIKAALEIGVSKEEITETLLIAALEGAGTQLTWAKEIFMKYLSNQNKE
jgi:AhpD family alkylhydroperoxidase